MGNSWYEISFGADYVARYAKRDTAEAERAVAAIAGGMRLDGAEVLDLCCGQGRHIPPLLAHGATRVVGLDLSQPLLDLARTNLAGLAGPDGARPVELVHADMREIPLPDQSLDAAVSFFSSFGYFADEADDRRVLQGVARVLRPGGRYALDFFNAPVAIATLVAEDQLQVEGETLTQRRHYDAATKRINKTVTGEDGRGIAHESVRAWHPAELTALAGACGLRVFAVLGDYHGAVFDPATSERFIALFERAGRVAD